MGLTKREAFRMKDDREGARKGTHDFHSTHDLTSVAADERLKVSREQQHQLEQQVTNLEGALSNAQRDLIHERRENASLRKQVQEMKSLHSSVRQLNRAIVSFIHSRVGG
jgi:hypothetical protein